MMQFQLSKDSGEAIGDTAVQDMNTKLWKLLNLHSSEPILYGKMYDPFCTFMVSVRVG